MYVAAWMALSIRRQAARACSSFTGWCSSWSLLMPRLTMPIDGLDGLLACHLACRVTAHPVGDEIQTKALFHKECVLVRLTLPPDVRKTYGRYGGVGRRARPVSVGSLSSADMAAIGESIVELVRGGFESEQGPAQSRLAMNQALRRPPQAQSPAAGHSHASSAPAARAAPATRARGPGGAAGPNRSAHGRAWISRTSAWPRSSSSSSR